MNSIVINLAHVHKLRIKIKNVAFHISEYGVNCLSLLLSNFVIEKISTKAKVCLCLVLLFS